MQIDIQPYIDKIPDILTQASQSYSKELAKIFASDEKYFEESQFKLSNIFDMLLHRPTNDLINQEDIKEKIRNFYCQLSFNREFNPQSSRQLVLTASKKKNDDFFTINLLINKEEINGISINFLENIIKFLLKDFLFSALLSYHFIASTERTGAAIFSK